MTALDEKRQRLRHELQAAYSAWLTVSDIYPSPDPSDEPVEACYSAPARMKWAAYIAAKERMVLAYAEQATRR